MFCCRWVNLCLTLVPIVYYKWRLFLDCIDVENFDAPAYAVGSDAHSFVTGTNLGEMIYPGSPGSKSIYCRRSRCLPPTDNDG